MKDFVRVVLPKHYDLVVGDTFQLFYRGIIEAANPFCYDILAVCEEGRNYPRYFEYTPQHTGCCKLTVIVFANDKTVLASGETMLCVHEAEKAPEKPVNILCVGDSLTAGGEWVQEAWQRLKEAYGESNAQNFRFIGTCKRENVAYEGYGGWKWEDYLQTDESSLAAAWVTCENNKAACDQHSIWADESGKLWQLETIEPGRLKFNRVEKHSGALPVSGSRLVHCRNAQNTEDICVKDAYAEGVNPFLNTESFTVDFKHYCRKNGFEGIDIVCFFLTWNSLFCEQGSVEVLCRRLAERGRQLADILHEQYPEAQIKIMGLQVPSVNGGTGASYGARLPYCDDYGLTRFVLELNRAYEAWTLEESYADFTEFINISGQFDSDNNMPAAEKPVNTRSKKTEMVGTNGVHPLPEGYWQIADAVFRSLVKAFNLLTDEGKKNASKEWESGKSFDNSFARSDKFSRLTKLVFGDIMNWLQSRRLSEEEL